MPWQCFLPHPQHCPIVHFGTVSGHCRTSQFRRELRCVRSDRISFRRTCHQGRVRHLCRCSLDTKEIVSDAQTPENNLLSINSREGASTDLSVIWSRLIKVRSIGVDRLRPNGYSAPQPRMNHCLIMAATAWDAVLERSSGGGRCAMEVGRSRCSDTGHNWRQVICFACSRDDCSNNLRQILLFT